jgi:cellulose 1,4-beta-cellobiosidase
MLNSLLPLLTMVFGLPTVNSQAAKCSVPAILDAQVNVWKTHTLHATSLYRLEVEQAVADIEDEELKGPASRVADSGTFMWMSVHI